LNVAELVAIDVHVHAWKDPEDIPGDSASQAAREYFKSEGDTPRLAQLGEYYRSRKIGCVVFSVDERLSGQPQVSNDDIIALAAANADIMLPFASVHPLRADAVAEVRRLIALGARGFKFHPPLQEYFANDPLAYPVYEEIAAARLPALFHTGHSGIGTGVRGGGGVRLKYGDPFPLDDVAVDFPDLTIIMAHPSFPWQDEAISICLHKPNVYIDLSGWSPKYFSPTLVQYANTLLRSKVLFGSDFPLITPDRWLADFARLDMRDEVRPRILRDNAVHVLGLAS